jgi:hypothetical protein
MTNLLLPCVRADISYAVAFTTVPAPIAQQPDEPAHSSRAGARKNQLVWVYPVALVFLYILQCAWFIQTQSFVIDEPLHIVAGLDAWRDGTFYRWNDHPPLARLWCTLPLISSKWQIDGDTLYRLRAAATFVRPDPEAMARRARSMNVVFGLILCAVVWFTARGALSVGAANFALTLFVLWPALVAHFSLVTTDGVATLFTFATAAYLLRWRRNPSAGRTAALGFLLGLLLLSKFSTPVMFAVAVCWMLVTAPTALFVANPLKWNWGKTFAAIAIAAVMVWGGYFFHVSHVAWHNGVFTATFPNRGPLVINVPRQSKSLNFSTIIPAGEFLEGLRIVIRHNSGGHASFLLGKISVKGFPLYFPLTIALKWPPLILLLFAAGFFLIAFRYVRVPGDWWILASFPAVYLCFAFASHIDIGERHILPIYPFVVLFAAVVWQFARPRPALVAALVLVLLLQGADILRYEPDDLSYFTPFVRPTQAHTLLTDSSLDWGEGLLALRNYQREHPDETISVATVAIVEPQVYGIRAHDLKETERVSGTVVLSATTLSGQLLKNPAAYNWVLQYPMVQMLNHSLFVFHVPPQPAQTTTPASSPSPATAKPSPADSVQTSPPQPK